MLADEETPLDKVTAFLTKHAAIKANDDGTLIHLDPVAFKAMKDDVLNHGQKLKDKDCEKFKEHMKLEMKGLAEAEMYDIVPIPHSHLT